jgi:hypothetical protein
MPVRDHIMPTRFRYCTVREARYFPDGWSVYGIDSKGQEWFLESLPSQAEAVAFAEKVEREGYQGP